MKYDEIFDSMTAEDFNGFMKTLSNDDILDYRASRDTPLAEDASSEGFQAYKRRLSGKTQSDFKDATLKKLEKYYQSRVSNYQDAIESAKGEKSITDANVLALNRAEQQLANIKELKNPEGTPYSEMSDYQKYKFGQEFGLNYFNASDRAKLDATATKLQEQASIKREQAKFETEHPWQSLALDILTPASQNARRRGEEPSKLDVGLDLASGAATFIPLIGPAAKLGLAAKVASKLKSPAFKLALTPAVGDVAANTAVTTAIDARNQKAEGKDFGMVKPEQLAKNFGTAVAGTALSGLVTRKSIPELAKTKIDPYIPNASKWLESKLVNPAEAVRDEVLRKNENITSSLAKASTGKFYEPEVRAVLKKAEIGEGLTAKDMKLLKKAGISEADLDTYLIQRANAASVQSLKKPVTLTEQRINEFNDSRVRQDAIKDTELGKHVNLEESMYAVPLNEESGYKKLLNAERKRRT